MYKIVLSKCDCKYKQKSSNDSIKNDIFCKIEAVFSFFSHQFVRGRVNDIPNILTPKYHR